jgi:hypothetical protein
VNDDDDAAEQSRKTPSPLESLSLSLSIVILLKLFSHLPFVVRNSKTHHHRPHPQRGTTINATHVMGDVRCRTYSLTWGGGMSCTSTLSRLFLFWCGKEGGQRGACEHMV